MINFRFIDCFCPILDDYSISYLVTNLKYLERRLSYEK